MTIKTKAYLKTLFETGDTVFQSSFEDLIDSFLDIGEVSAQTVTGPVIFTNTVVVSGTPIDVPSGGTSQSSYTDGQLLIGNSIGNTLTKNTLTAGTGISIANGNGTITINSTINNINAWVNFNGTGTVAIRDSSNVSSITDNATGNYTINFTTPFSNSNYAAALSVEAQISDTGPLIANFSQGGTYSTSALQIVIQGPGGTDSDAAFISALLTGDI